MDREQRLANLDKARAAPRRKKRGACREPVCSWDRHEWVRKVRDVVGQAKNTAKRICTGEGCQDTPG